MALVQNICECIPTSLLVKPSRPSESTSTRGSPQTIVPVQAITADMLTSSVKLIARRDRTRAGTRIAQMVATTVGCRDVESGERSAQGNDVFEVHRVENFEARQK